MRTYEICKELLGVPSDEGSPNSVSPHKRPSTGGSRRPGIGADFGDDTRYFQRDYDGNIDDEEECKIEFYTRPHFQVRGLTVLL